MSTIRWTQTTKAEPNSPWNMTFISAAQSYYLEPGLEIEEQRKTYIQSAGYQMVICQRSAAGRYKPQIAAKDWIIS